MPEKLLKRWIFRITEIDIIIEKELNIEREWRLNAREKVKEGDPAVYAILTNPEYKLPTVLPDGKYKAKTFTIQPYSK